MYPLTTARAVIVNQLFRFASAIIFQILLTHSTLTTNQIGDFETLIFAWVSINLFWLPAFTNVSLLLLNFFKTEKIKIENFLARQFFFAALLNFIFSICFARMVSPQIFSTAPFSFLFWSGQIFLNANNFTEYKLIAAELPKKILVFGILNLLLPYTILGVCIFLGASRYYAVGVFFAYSFCESIFYLSRHLNNDVNSKNKAEFNKEFWRAVPPLVGYATLNNVSGIFTQSLVLSFYKLHPEGFATYRYGSRELPFTLAITNGYGLAAQNKIADAESLKIFKSGARKIMFQIFGITWLLLLTSWWLIPFVFTPKFSGATAFFNITLLYVFSRALMPQVILRAKNLQRPILYAGIIETVFIVFGSALFFNFAGVEGVLYVLVVGFWLEKMVLSYFVKVKLRINFTDYTPLPTYLFCSLVTLIIFFLVK